MTVNRFLTAALGAAMLLTACNVRESIYETDHPEQAKITVTTDWRSIGAGITKPAAWKASYGSETLTATTDKYTFTNLLKPGEYTIYFYNEAAAIPVTGKTAAVNAVTPPAGTTGSYVEPMPDWLFTGSLSETVEKNKHHEFTVTMAQQVRQLTIIIEPSGGTADKIATITGTLSGVAGGYNMESGTHTAPSDVALAFAKQTSGDHTGKWTATVRLLGVAGAEQKLTGTISFIDVTPAYMSLVSNLSAYLAGFNNNKKEPLTLGGQVIETPSSTGFTAIINDWNPINGRTGIAN